MASQICFHLSIHCHNPCKIHTTLRASSLPQTLKPRPGNITGKDSAATSLFWSRRQLNFSILLVFLNGFWSKSSEAATMAPELELERYTDANEGFTLLRPSSWIKVEKAGATVLFEEGNKGINNVGVVVSPVRLASLGEFGTPQFVADKLIQADKRKIGVHEGHRKALRVLNWSGFQRDREQEAYKFMSLSTKSIACSPVEE